ncbi:LlaJI family restriction endonuclease [Flavobacterium sedimenticola]|uniref:LlaJI family restriction endonuclease n=1 Tax=Flavobacterium sedimenticola TaxID=3043286 RepID=A0ABT6XN70_9FLAO|nr:LlaJI family restriction endonuclease [Flavobacterium sedimenticola]MDI9256520.1 LlaJI family restriction endonuclease [Flavobacterium sedimenticola]
MQDIFLGQDGTFIFESTKKEFELVQGLDTRFKNKDINSEVYDFVGLVCKKDKTLVVFPKHYYSNNLLKENEKDNNSSEQDVHLLFDVIQKYIFNRKSTATKFAGEKLDFESDYPFASFFSVYNYFKQFGIYNERITKTKVGYKGKISWKDTIRKSHKIYSNGNLIHLPLYIKENKSKQVFISDCMAFVIDYTLERFPFLFQLAKTNHKKTTFDFLENIDFVIRKLQEYKNQVFKDINKRLISDLINYFTEIEGHKKGGDIHVKIKYFNLVWEEMIGHYLNNHFSHIDNDNNLYFETENINSKVRFSKKTFQVDKSINNFTIEPDHYFIDDDLQYIFDAKYYDVLDHLNYKQYSYHEMLKSNKDENKTISALIIPSDNENTSEIHFSLADSYVKEGTSSTTIISQKLKTKDVMISYLNSNLNL